MTPVLLDAGPMVALFDPKSRANAHYRDLLADQDLKLRPYTTWPCVVEACHFLSAPRRWALLYWISEGGAMVFPFDPLQLQEMLPAMQRYTELPRSEMDFADATLLWLAEDTGVRDILTLDVRDFSRYRLDNGKAFNIL
jgi:uncharacterized protein